MIVPMKKVSFVVLDSQKKYALEQLRSLGLVHLEKLEGSGETLASLRASWNKTITSLNCLKDIALPKDMAKKAKNISLHPVLKADAVYAVVEKVSSLVAEKRTLEELIIRNGRECERFVKWGGIDPEDFTYLAHENIVLMPYEIPVSKYTLLPKDVEVLRVNADKAEIRFLLIAKDGVRPDNLPPDAFAVFLPEKSTKVLQSEIDGSKIRIAAIDDELLSLTVNITAMKKYGERLEKEIEFEVLYTGMGYESESEKSAHRLAWIIGYVPACELPAVQTRAKDEKWALLAEEPAEEDEVPTKLKNNKLVSLIYPVSDFLGIVPGYREYDISNWFLLFFTIFFGMIFGDAGYGSLLVLVALGGICMAVRKKKSPPAVMMLLLLLGSVTIVWGVLTCSWFGLLPDQIPAVLQNISIWQFNNANPEAPKNIKIFCFTLALIQLSIAHLKGIAHNIRSLKLLGDLGSLFMVWGMYSLVLNMVVDSVQFPMTNVTFILIGTGFGLSFIFSNYAGSVIASVLESFKNIISVMLGVVNVFSDIVSYIRLWAVGIAGAAIAQTVNLMAGPLLGGFLIFAGILLLTFGHGLNMILNVLSVIVHGVRLNTLEFSTHLGMTWSGVKYEPFKAAVEK